MELETSRESREMARRNGNESVVVIERVSRAVPLLAILSVVLAAACALLGARIAQTSAQPSIDETVVTKQLKACSDLATSKMMYRGLVTYTSGNIELWDKKSFQMIYDAEIKAGVDMSETDVSMDGKRIEITLPAATIQDVSIDPDSVKIYDQKYSLLNWSDRSDTSAAMSEAKADAREAAEKSDMTGQADAQARAIVKQMFAVIDGQDGYEVDVKTRKDGGKGNRKGKESAKNSNTNGNADGTEKK